MVEGPQTLVVVTNLGKNCGYTFPALETHCGGDGFDALNNPNFHLQLMMGKKMLLDKYEIQLILLALQGRQRFQQLQKYVALAFAVVQAVGQLTYIRPYVDDWSFYWLFESTSFLVAGASILIYVCGF